MSLLQAVIGQLVTIVLFGLLGLTVMKAFQIASELSEIKDLLQDIKRNTSSNAAAPSSPMNLARAVNAAASTEDQMAQHKALIDQALRDEAL